MNSTRTYALLQVSAETYAEIRKLLLAADYTHALHSDDGREVIDMHGIALMDTPGRAVTSPGEPAA